MTFKRIYVEIGNICNLHCLFCSTDNQKKRQMTLQEFEKVLNNIKGYTDYLYLHVKGEPLMHPYFQEILDLAKRYNYQVNLTTNATLLSENLEIFKTNDAIRQVNISAHSLVYLSEVKKTKYLNSLYDLVKWNSVEKKIYISIRLWVQNEEINKLVFDYFSNKFGCKFDFNSNKITDNCFFSFEEEFEWPNISNPVITNRGRCHGTFDHLGILANGSVVACCLDSNGETTFGNIFDETLEEIMNKDSFIDFHDNMNKNILVHELCKRCSYHLKFDKK